MKNTRAKTVDRAHAYETRLDRDTVLWALKYYQSEESEETNPYAKVKVSRQNGVTDRTSLQHIDDPVGRDMYVASFKEFPLIQNPLASNMVEGTIEESRT